VILGEPLYLPTDKADQSISLLASFVDDIREQYAGIERASIDQSLIALKSCLVTASWKPSIVSHQMKVLRAEYGADILHLVTSKVDGEQVIGIDVGREDLLKLLTELCDIEQKLADDSVACKARDNARGIHIIPDYAHVNEFARDGYDSVTKLVRQRAVNVTSLVSALKAKI
jgi:hypothetical protein